MSNYTIQTVTNRGEAFKVIYDLDTNKFFAGYDFMGSVNWEDADSENIYLTDEDDPEQIVADLRAADEPTEPAEDPAKKQYLFKVLIEDEWCISIKTGKQIADYYETDQIAGICSSMEVWDVSGDPVRIDLYSLVEPILANKRWMEQEYRDYCENEAYGDY